MWWWCDFFNTIYVLSHMHSENPEGTKVIVGSMNMRYISDTARNRTHNLFRPKREPIPLDHNDGRMVRHTMMWWWIGWRILLWQGHYIDVQHHIAREQIILCSTIENNETKLLRWIDGLSDHSISQTQITSFFSALIVRYVCMMCPGIWC